MKRQCLISLVFIIAIFLVACNGTQENNKEKENTEKSATEKKVEKRRSQMYMNCVTDREEAEGWMLLFDGKTTKGWHSFGQENIKGWKIEDGCLVGLGSGGDMGGDIITDTVFSNFILTIEWKISKGGNSGIFYRAKEEGYETIYATGPEYQIIDAENFESNLEDWQTTAANYAMHPAQDPPIKPYGEWNTTKIIAKGSHVEHWLNGKKVVEYELWTDEWKEKVKDSKWADYPDYGMAKTGHIGLQDHGSKVWFRNIKIKPLQDVK